MTVTFNQYQKEYIAFCRRHAGADVREYTGSEAGDVYHKTRCYSDGGTWYEVRTPARVQVDATIRGTSVGTITADLWRFEYWSSDDAKSKYFYQQ